jgi:hypothetical protein
MTFKFLDFIMQHVLIGRQHRLVSECCNDGTWFPTQLFALLVRQRLRPTTVVPICLGHKHPVEAIFLAQCYLIFRIHAWEANNAIERQLPDDIELIFVRQQQNRAPRCKGGTGESVFPGNHGLASE